MTKLASLTNRLPLAALLLTLTAAISSCSRYNANGSTSMWGIIILVLDVLALFDVFRQQWTIGKKILWAAIIFFFPLGGLIIYYLFAGRGKASV
ncbi:Phospholipase_D-nuclease N-terminal [Hymenobacter daecheongensis DSM 21074]|uniref:Phospholipase_D-nuclease N-terminal n=1 Tax=Hymenobacter daecheongensis DSM 21074 TaxID=1121955 RepID=A0A1M6BA30_9BACT|nr:PLD nuclease N-terminal domain-containing protein [Hymenobacter daecheongensis]SHI45546.1 Phospholipase_D-nuclease N-terminal [Hymenobacter daecheongensis DSM 21074]